MPDHYFKLDPNRHAQPEEIQILGANLALDIEMLDMLEVRIATAATVVRDAEQKARIALEALDSARVIHGGCVANRDELQGRINYARGLAHPIRRLPDELLQLIMLIEITEASRRAMDLEIGSFNWKLQERRYLQRLPYRRAAVSQAWRRVAIHSPALWVHIVLNFEDISVAKNWNFATATEALYEQLGRAAKKDLILLVDGGRTTKTISDWFEHMIWAPDVLSRLTHLQLVRLTNGALHKLDVHGVGPSRLLTAEFYHISSDDDSTLPSALLEWMAPSIATLRFYDCSVPWSRLCPLPALRSLKSMNENVYVSFNDLADIARNAPGITKLEINAGMLGDDAAQLETIEFNEVQHLVVIAYTTRPLCTALRFPHVIDADLCAYDQINDACALLLQNGVLGSGPNRLRSLCLRETGATQALARVFYELNFVESFTMMSSRHTEGFCALMSEKDERGRWALPRLDNLNIETHCRDVEDPDEILEQPLLQMIHKRQEISRNPASGLATLVHCDVFFSCNAALLSKDFEVKLQQAISAGS